LTARNARDRPKRRVKSAPDIRVKPAPVHGENADFLAIFTNARASAAQNTFVVVSANVIVIRVEGFKFFVPLKSLGVCARVFRGAF
jgi:hypothetical protein